MRKCTNDEEIAVYLGTLNIAKSSGPDGLHHSS